MLFRTHLALGLFIVLLFLPKVNYEFTFILVTFIGTLLPDIDQGYSRLGEKKIFRPLQFFVKHRGMMHSFSFCLLVSIVLAYFPFTVQWALPFFLGYGVHLFADSFTLEGIKPFWPYKGVSRGFLRVGSRVETILFVILILLDIFIGVLVLG